MARKVLPIDFRLYEETTRLGGQIKGSSVRGLPESRLETLLQMAPCATTGDSASGLTDLESPDRQLAE